MKKFVKPIIIILILLILFVLINFSRNYLILRKIINRGNEILSSSSYHIKIETEIPFDNFKSYNDIFYKDNIYLIKTTTSNDDSVELYWKNYSTQEDNSYYIYQENIIEATFNEELISSIKSSLTLDYMNIFKTSLFSIIPIKNNNYIINEHYFDKNTGTLCEINYINNNSNSNILDTIQKYTITLDTVTDNDIAKPEI